MKPMLFLFAGLSLCPWIAQGDDFIGSEDHPMISRYQGSYIDGYEVQGFDEYRLALGKSKDQGGQLVAERQLDLEGRVTRILYRGPKDRTVYEIFSNYRTALEGAGFEILYTCSEEECGNSFDYVVYGPDNRIESSRSAFGAFDMIGEIRYLAARLSDADREVHVALLTGFDHGFAEASQQPVVLLDIIEGESMDTGMVTVDAEAMGEGIDQAGHIDLYGIRFETNSAAIQPESSSVLAEIARLLQARPDLRILIVGHTDNQGEFQYNMDLSSRRARAVLDYMVNTHGIEAARMRAEGVGFLAPVASNDHEQGRSHNRRVVLVKM